MGRAFFTFDEPPREIKLNNRGYGTRIPMSSEIGQKPAIPASYLHFF